MTQLSRDVFKDWDVLILDDEKDNLQVAAFILNRYGALVHTGLNGKEGLEILNQLRPRFIISDLSMPVMDGWDFIAVLQKDPKLAKIPIIALSAHTRAGDQERALSLGFCNYLTKPFTVNTFINDLVNILADIPEFSQYFDAYNNS